MIVSLVFSGSSEQVFFASDLHALHQLRLIRE